MVHNSLVSIIMGVHNEPIDYIETAINSIISQTYQKWELIIIDDYSNMECSNYLKQKCVNYKNILLLRNSHNQGLTRSLNIGLDNVHGKYIARMDADDYSLAVRIERQVDYLENHPDIDVLGTGVISFGETYKFISPAFGYNDDQAQCELFFSSTLCHPSVMLRKSFLDNNELRYDEAVKKGQDYDLWERCSIHGKIAVLSDVLLFYRLHPQQISSLNKNEQNSTTINVWKRRLSRIGIIPTEKELTIHCLLTKGQNNSIQIYEVKNWIDKILVGNKKCRIAPQNILHKNLDIRLTLFKLRNHHLSSCNLHDCINILYILIQRCRSLAKLKLLTINPEI